MRAPVSTTVESSVSVLRSVSVPTNSTLAAQWHSPNCAAISISSPAVAKSVANTEGERLRFHRWGKSAVLFLWKQERHASITVLGLSLGRAGQTYAYKPNTCSDP